MRAMEEIAHLADVPIDIEVELGRRAMTVAEILKLNVGHSIRLGRSAGENVDLYVGEVLSAFGEIVLIENSIGVRITDFVE